MSSREAVGVRGSVERLVRGGTVAGHSDAELLERYATRRDPTAFEALLGRHGAIVLGVCRRRLRDPHAAEDAFQATFLVLVRRAGSLRVQSTLGPRLHEVARRVAERAWADAARRRDRESAAGAFGLRDARTDGEADRRELAGLIVEELTRLPEKYRTPVVLCHLEGLTHEEAARRGCPDGTVGVRLMRARARLRERLSRRVPTAAVPPLIETLSSGGLPREFVPIASTEAATGIATGTSAAAAPIADLSQGVLRAMMRSRLRAVTLGQSSLGAFAAVAALALAARDDGPKPARLVVGKVVDEAGRSIPGAEVRLNLTIKTVGDRTVGAVADAEGRFALPISREALDAERRMPRAAVWAHAPGRSIGTGGFIGTRWRTIRPRSS